MYPGRSLIITVFTTTFDGTSGVAIAQAPATAESAVAFHALRRDVQMEKKRAASNQPSAWSKASGQGPFSKAGRPAQMYLPEAALPYSPGSRVAGP